MSGLQSVMQRRLPVGGPARRQGLRCPPAAALAVLCMFPTMLCVPASLAQQQSPVRLSPQQIVEALESAQVDAIAKAEKSVVAVARVRWDLENDRPHADAGARQGRPGRTPDPTSPDFIPNEFAAGVAVDRRGLVLTNYHVLGDVEQNRYFVWINRRPFAAVVHAADPWTDLAVLRIEADDLKPIVFGDASRLRKGQLVIALGNPYGIARDGQVSASRGIVANLSRQAPPLPGSQRAPQGRETLHHYGTLIQTDARLNLGTSGGALINLKGEMVGLTTSLAALVGFEKEAGFALPINDAVKRVVDTLKRGEAPAFGFLGVEPEHLALRERQGGRLGVRVHSVVEGAAGDLAGVREGDVITHVNGVAVSDSNDFVRDLSQRAFGDEVRLTVERGGPNRTPRTILLTARLMKKHVASRQPAVSQTETRQWRGMHVEFATATPQFLDFAGRVDPAACVGVLSVERDSPSWRAEMRAGDFITHIGRRSVSSPEEFFAAAQAASGPVEVRVARFSGDPVMRTIEP